MIRILFGSALPILGLGAAAALLGPDLVTGPRGEPMIVAAPNAAMLQKASFDGPACARLLVLDEEQRLQRLGDPAKPVAGAHVVTLAFRYGEEGASMVIERGDASPEADETFILVVDEAGRILAVSGSPALGQDIPEGAYADCLAENRPAGI